MGSIDVGETTDDALLVGPLPTWMYAYAFLVAMLASFALGYAFFAIGGIYGPLSDLSGMLTSILLAPLVVALFRLHRGEPQNRSVYYLGVAAVASELLGSTGLVVGALAGIGPVAGAFLACQFFGIMLQGAWLIAIGVIGLRSDRIARRVSWSGLLAGVGMFVAVSTLSETLDWLNPVFLVGAGVTAVGILLWAFLLGSELRREPRDAGFEVGVTP